MLWLLNLLGRFADDRKVFQFKDPAATCPASCGSLLSKDLHRHCQSEMRSPRLNLATRWANSLRRQPVCRQLLAKKSVHFLFVKRMGCKKSDPAGSLLLALSRNRR